MRTLIVVAGTLALAGIAAAAPSELAISNLNTPAGKLTALAANTVYQASSFPLGLRLSAPDGTWAGSQWTTSSRGKKTFAWVAVGHGGTTATTPPQGVITLITPIGVTPSVAATVARIHQGGSGITFQKYKSTLQPLRGARAPTPRYAPRSTTAAASATSATMIAVR
jgi:hypothetical protein